MKIVIDTNVVVSGVFFGGPPGAILEAWLEGRIQVVISPEILDEYMRVGDELAAQFPEVDQTPFIEQIARHAELVDCPPLDAQICADADDDKFLACAVAVGATCIVSGDKLLLKASGYRDVDVIRPKEFVDRYLTAG